MAEDPDDRPRSTPIVLIQRALRRPYLFMAAVVLIVGAIWFFRLAVQEFLLIDRLINIYTNDAQVQMDAVAVRPAITAEVLEVSVGEGQAVQKGDVLILFRPDEIKAELQEAEAAAEVIAHQLHDLREELPLTRAKAQQEVARAEALLETKRHAYRSAEILLHVHQDRTTKMMREHAARVEAEQARLQERETAAREAERTRDRARSLFEDGIVSQDQLDTAEMALERAKALLLAAQSDVRQTEEHYPAGDSPHMIRVHEQELQRFAAELQEQEAALEMARTNLQLAQRETQKLKILEAKHKAALARVEACRLKLDRTVIRSPVDGIVAYRHIEPGEMVEGDPSNPPIMILHNPRSRWIAANVWESDISRVQLGNEVDIWIDAFKISALGRGKPFKGRVIRINPTTYSEVAGLPPERFFTRREQKIPVGVSIEGEDPGLRAGMLAEVLIYPGPGAEAKERRN